MSLNVKVDDSHFQRSMERYQRDFDMSASEVVGTQHRLLLQDTVRALPPKRKKQGADAVDRSLRNAASPLDQKTWNSEPIRDMIRSQRIDSLEAVFQRIPRRTGWKVRRFDPALHHRAKVRGKVRRSQKVAVVPATQWKRYRTRLRKRPGLLKGSIAGGIVRLGGRVPKWIATHIDAGMTTDRRRNRNPSIITESRLSYSRNYRWATRGLARGRMRKAAADLRRRSNFAAKKNGF